MSLKYLLAMLWIGILVCALPACSAFVIRTISDAATASPLFCPQPLMATSVDGKKKGYDPKWKKKKTLAEELGIDGTKDLAQVGLKGTIPVVFKQGNVTKTTMAIPGQPLRDVAIQAGQFIKYGCGKGECGTCEALVNGQWIRPCSVGVPALAKGEEYVVQVKEVKAKSKSSGKFYSIRSFFMGFWNNLLGMIGFVKYRRNAKQNWNERREYEDLIRQKSLEKKAAKIKADQANLKP
ncbi:hypothetical protein ACA910_017156 [Epithemia clementina (nom. ined.)]